MPTKLTNVFPKESLEVLDKLLDAGHQAYIVGGSLRDALLGIECDDIDISTSARPEEVIQVFQDYSVIPTGIKHGTVTVVCNGLYIEITTFRVDGAYVESRRPISVEYTTSLERDSNRRDFTINALAYNPRVGIVDLVGGLADLENGVIRAINNPDIRFSEDPLKMMRGLRFASKLGFEIEPETEAALFRNSHRLSAVSGERLHVELNGVLMGKSVYSVLTKYSRILEGFIPELGLIIDFDQNTPFHNLDAMAHSAKVVEHCEHDVATRLAGLLHDIGKPNTEVVNDKGISNYLGHAEESVEIARKVINRLKYSNDIKKKALRLIADHDVNFSKRPYAVKKKLYDYGVERFFETLNFQRADDLGKNPKYLSRVEFHNTLEKIARDYLADSPILTHKDISLTAHDLMDLGYSGGDIQVALDKCSYAVMGGIKDTKESLVNYLAKNPIVAK